MSQLPGPERPGWRPLGRDRASARILLYSCRRPRPKRLGGNSRGDDNKVTTNDESAKLIDRFGRHVTYARLSVTDRCDFRCVYCMSEDMTFLPRAQVLTLEEIFTVARAFTRLGVKKLRLTGGEPLVRRNIMSLVSEIGRLPGLEELTLTTNGSQLDRMAGPLSDAGVKRINVSLDSLDEQRFRNITRVGDLDKVLRGIEAAREAGFRRLKLNTVILKNRNEDEILNLVDYVVERGMDISFIEEMPLGLVDDRDRALTFYSSDEVRRDIEARYTLIATTDALLPGRRHRLPGRLHLASQSQLLRVLQSRARHGAGSSAVVPRPGAFCGSAPGAARPSR